MWYMHVGIYNVHMYCMPGEAISRTPSNNRDVRKLPRLKLGRPRDRSGSCRICMDYWPACQAHIQHSRSATASRTTEGDVTASSVNASRMKHVRIALSPDKKRRPSGARVCTGSAPCNCFQSYTSGRTPSVTSMRTSRFFWQPLYHSSWGSRFRCTVKSTRQVVYKIVDVFNSDLQKRVRKQSLDGHATIDHLPSQGGHAYASVA